MVPPWFVHRFRGFRWRNHGRTIKEPWRKYEEKYFRLLPLCIYNKSDLEEE
ncbi:MAG: hypothetical protein N4A37_13000 [Prolixibacteraceae bacterium]|nr:hypothetical protein [Prolixibacteraceae bacterium]